MEPSLHCRDLKRSPRSSISGLASPFHSDVPSLKSTGVIGHGNGNSANSDISALILEG